MIKKTRINSCCVSSRAHPIPSVGHRSYQDLIGFRNLMTSEDNFDLLSGRSKSYKTILNLSFGKKKKKQTTTKKTHYYQHLCRRLYVETKINMLTFHTILQTDDPLYITLVSYVKVT